MSLLGCQGGPDSLPQVVRLEPEQVPSVESVSVAEDLLLGGQPIQIDVTLDAERYDQLAVRVRGAADLLEISWLAGDETSPTPGSLKIPILPSEASTRYEVDLGETILWTGTVVRIGLRSPGAPLVLESLELSAPRRALRPVSLAGVTVPSVGGREEIVLELPPRGELTRFQFSYGLRPGGRVSESSAYFSVRKAGDPSEEPLWHAKSALMLTAGGKSRSARWTRAEVELAPSVDRLLLRVEGQRDVIGRSLWGNPRLASVSRDRGQSLVLVVIDTLRADHVGTWSRERSLTPNLDLVAAEGLRLQQLVAPAPWTLPSVATLLTGRQPQFHGAGKRTRHGYVPTGLDGAAITLAEVLADRGLVTVGIYNNQYLQPSFGIHQGFDWYRSMLHAPAERLVDSAIEELKRIGDQRFFLYLHLLDPHGPYRPPLDLCRSELRRIGLKVEGPQSCTAERSPLKPPPVPGDRAKVEALYRAEIAYTDRELGRLFRAIDDLGLGESTVLGVVSDHGEDLFERADELEGMGYFPRSDHGHVLYQELLHVPGILRGVGVPRGSISGPMELVDLFPTLLTLLGEEPGEHDGQDFASRGFEDRRDPRLLIADFILYGEKRWSARKGPWKLIQTMSGRAEPELYHLGEDPRESKNVVSREGRVAERLQRLAEAELARRAQSRDAWVGESYTSPYLSWEEIQTLRSLGYLK